MGAVSCYIEHVITFEFESAFAFVIRFLHLPLDLHRFQVRHFSNNIEQSPCYCKIGQRQSADLGVF